MSYVPPDSPALQEARKEVAASPRSGAGYTNLSTALRQLGRIYEAEEAARRAVELEPRESFAYSALGEALKEGGLIGEAIAAFRRAVELSPHDAEVHSGLLLAMSYSAMDPLVLKAEHERWGAIHAEGLKPKTSLKLRENRGKLRVGFLSGSFYNHPVAQFVGPLLSALPHDGMEVYCYASVGKPDGVTNWLQTLAVKWRDVSGTDDGAAAEQIRRDEIDVLIDLDGHTGTGRLLVFAHQPAAVQVTWLGSMGTTGMSAMGWRLSDQQADPAEAAGYYSEKLLYLPRTIACYGPPADAPPVASLPALSRGYLTFGSFAMLGKISPQTWRLWAGATRAVPNSRLRLIRMGLHEAEIQDRVRAAFAEAGGDPNCLEMFPGSGFVNYMKAHNEVDLLLDTQPFSGHTTTCNALWMGVPTMTFAGHAPASRSGVSVAAAAMLGGLVARDERQFVELVTRFVSDLRVVNEIRLNLRKHLAQTALLGAKGFVRDFYTTLTQAVAWSV